MATECGTERAVITRRVLAKLIRPCKLDGVADAIGTHTTNEVREAMLVAASEGRPKAVQAGVAAAS